MKQKAIKEDKRRRDPIQTKRALMTAGLHLFSERGYDGSTIDEIAKFAGVNKALISYYFKGKRGLQDEIHAEAFSLLEPLIQTMTTSNSPAPDQLREFIRAMAGLAGANPDYPVMLLRSLIAGETDPEGDFATRVLQLNQTLAAILEKGVISGRFRKADPLLTQISILGSLLFFFATEKSRIRMVSAGKLKPGAPSTNEFIEHMQELIVRGLSPAGCD